jgi:hypothetical protein
LGFGGGFHSIKRKKKLNTEGTEVGTQRAQRREDSGEVGDLFV